jgi:hypothetical protein
MGLSEFVIFGLSLQGNGSKKWQREQKVAEKDKGAEI